MGSGGDEVERSLVEPAGVNEVIHRRRDVVNGHDVGRAEVGRDEWDKSREPRESVDDWEEVIGPVDLVHLTGDGVPDDDRGSVHAPGDGAITAYDVLRPVLRRVIGRRKPLTDVEHRLGEQSFAIAGNGN